MPVHQLLVTAASGDAVTSLALALRRELLAAGPSEVFAVHVDPALGGEVRPVSEFGRNGEGADLLVYHASIGNETMAAFLETRSEPILLAYHNISPPGPFRAYDAGFAELLELGREHLAALAGRVRAAVADSAFNAAELVELGYPEVTTVPVPLDPYRLARLEPDAGTAAALAGLPGPVVAFVGQLLPHKRVEWLIGAFHVLATYLEPEATLLVAGAPRLPAYAAALGEFVRELNLAGVHLLGAVSDAALAALYRRADVFVTASEHEGFCVPLLEAMAFDVPVVARRFAAVPETLGGAGLLLDPDDGPEAAAEAVVLATEDLTARRALVEAGRRRLEAFDPEGALRQLGVLALRAAGLVGGAASEAAAAG
jgi:glycosyltransferase involved in cell wall biosynthesis